MPYVVDGNGIERYFGLHVPSEEDLAKMDLIEVVYRHNYDNSLPDTVDYTAYMLPVKDQGRCGSCWIFSSVSVVEGLLSRARGQTVPLSTGEPLDCCLAPVVAQRCMGGEPFVVFAYAQHRGLCPAAAYPYRIDLEACRLHACPESAKAHIRAFGLIRAQTQRDLATALHVHGPLVVGMDASGLHNYTSGLYTNCTATPDVNHALALVGLVERHGQLAWKIQNSWGPGFGEDGFFYMPYGATHDCGLLSLVTFGVA